MPRRTYDDSSVLKAGEVAELFRVDPKTVTRWANMEPPRLPSFRTPGNHRRFRWVQIKHLIGQGESE